MELIRSKPPKESAKQFGEKIKKLSKKNLTKLAENEGMNLDETKFDLLCREFLNRGMQLPQ